MLTKGNKDLPVEKVTAENFLVPKGEEKRYHVKMEIPRYDSATGKKLSKARIMSFGINTFKTLGTSIKKQGYTMEILHDPLKVEETKAPADPKNPRSSGKKPGPDVAPTTDEPEPGDAE